MNLNLKYLLSLEDVYIFIITALILLLLYVLSGKSIKKSRMHNDQKRRTIAKLKYLFLFTLFILIFILWATELYQFIISIAAIAAGFAIATKEVFLCLGGSFYRGFASPFVVGDRIEINGTRGDVVDIGLFGTQLLEVGPKDLTHQFTGRTVTIPNSTFLTKQILNETDSVNHETDFTLHVFMVPIKNDTHWNDHKDTLYESTNLICDKYTDPATKFFKELTNKRQVDMPAIAPKITIKFLSPETLNLIVRITVPAKMKGLIEQEIVKDYLEKSHHE